MEQAGSATVRLKVSPEVARIVQPGAPRDAQLLAARGALPLGDSDLLVVLFLLCNSGDAEIRNTAIKTLRQIPEARLLEGLKDAALLPQLLELLARARSADVALMHCIITHPATTSRTLLYLAGKAGRGVLARLVEQADRLEGHPDIVDAIMANPATDDQLRAQLGRRAPETESSTDDEAFRDEPEPDMGAEEDCAHDEGRSQEEIEALMRQVEQEGLSKYQIALELKVAEKIKMGLTGDKEWRSLMIKQANKLIQGAVLKNPRITDGEVLAIAKNKSSSEDLVRMILLNKDWMKNYDIKMALVTHPKTPPPKAMRLVPFLGLKDLKQLAKSRQVSTLVATAARKELDLRLKKMGG